MTTRTTTQNLLAAPSTLVAPPSISTTFDLINVADWADAEPPGREWMLDGWLPRNRAAYITGAGGAGKSLLGQQLATCIALGWPFLGIPTTQASAIYLTAEDDHDELQRRQRAICNKIGASESDLAMKLFPVSLFGRADNAMVAFERDAGLVVLPAWEMLKNTARVTLSRFVVIDNISHVFGGNEIDRSQVTAWANLLNGLAAEIRGSVLLIGHPNKAGDAYSGSTAFENAFRARLYFDAPKALGTHTDPDLRQLSLPKANYARKGAVIDVRWHEGALILDEESPPSLAEELRQVSADTAANDAFLRCLDVATAQRRAVSHVPGVNYAPKFFASLTEGRGYSQEAFKGAMERLAHLGLILFDEALWQGKNRHWKQGIKRNPDAAPTSLRQPPAPTCANPDTNSLENNDWQCANPARQPPLSPTGISGGAYSPTPPDIPEDELDWEP